MSDPIKGNVFVDWANLKEEQRREIATRLQRMLAKPDDYYWTFDTTADKWRAIARDSPPQDK